MHFSISPPWQWDFHLRLVHEARAGETPTILSEQVQRWKVGKGHLAILGVDCGLTMEQDSWSHWKVVWQAWVLIEVHSIIVHCTFQSDQGPDVQLYTWIGVIHITWQRKHQRKISRTHVCSLCNAAHTKLETFTQTAVWDFEPFYNVLILSGHFGTT